MDGCGTLIWNRIIRLRFPEWLTGNWGAGRYSATGTAQMFR